MNGAQGSGRVSHAGFGADAAQIVRCEEKEFSHARRLGRNGSGRQSGADGRGGARPCSNAAKPGRGQLRRAAAAGLYEKSTDSAAAASLPAPSDALASCATVVESSARHSGCSHRCVRSRAAHTHTHAHAGSHTSASFT